MLPEIRQSKIIEILNVEGSVKVSDVSKLFQLTEKTIRDDLEKLEQRGILKRVHGGAVLVEQDDSMLPIINRRIKQHVEKEQIAAEACKLVEDGQVLLLDAGSTTLELAALIQNRMITVVTNDTKIADLLAGSSQIDLCVLGGYRRKGTYTIIGPTAIHMMEELNVDIAFLGCTGIDLERGLSIFNREEAELKKRMMKAAKKVVLLADYTKFERTALVSFAALEEIDLVVTDAGTGDAVLDSIGEMGVQVIRTLKGKTAPPS